MALASSEMLEVTDMEEVEVTETDAALLRELMEDQSENEEFEKDRVKQMVHDLENELNADSLVRTEELNVDGFEYCWPEMVEISPGVDETIAWYVDGMIGTGEIDCNIDYSELYSGVFFEEETGYGCLWQD